MTVWGREPCPIFDFPPETFYICSTIIERTTSRLSQFLSDVENMNER